MVTVVTVEQILQTMSGSPYSKAKNFLLLVDEHCAWAEQAGVRSVKLVVKKIIKSIDDTDPPTCSLSEPPRCYFNNGTLGSHRGSGVMRSIVCYRGSME